MLLIEIYTRAFFVLSRVFIARSRGYPGDTDLAACTIDECNDGGLCLNVEN